MLSERDNSPADKGSVCLLGLIIHVHVDRDLEHVRCAEVDIGCGYSIDSGNGGLEIGLVEDCSRESCEDRRRALLLSRRHG